MSQHLHLSDLGPGHGAPPARDLDIVWVPGEEIACQQLEVPPVSRKKWLAMVPWMLEEKTLDGAGELDIACGERGGDGRVPVIAVKKVVLAGWQKLLAEEGISYRRLVPDFFALPWRDGATTVAVLGDRCLLRRGPWYGTAGSRGLILPLVEKLLPGGADELRVIAGSDEELPLSLSGSLSREKPTQLFAVAEPPLLAIITTDPRRRRWPLPARVAAGLGALTVALAAVGTVVESRQIADQADHFEVELRQAYRRYFGESYQFDMADFQRVVSARLDEGAAGGGLPSALERLDAVLAGCGDCRIDRLMVSGESVSALLSGAGVEGRLASRGEGIEIEARGAGWLVTLGVER